MMTFAPRKLSVLLMLGLYSLLAGCQSHAVAQDEFHPGKPSFSVWLEGIKAEAIAKGIPPAVVANAFDGVRLNESILEKDRYQPEFVRPVWEYLDLAVSDARVSNGRARFAEHRALLQQVAQTYGVEPQIIVAIWGLETSYGAFFGNDNVIEAFSTLAYDGRRAEFARTQLFAALKILAKGDIPPGEMLGSWAGAMGHTQFIPTSYLERAVDFDGDGRRDIWGSFPDVFASTANYLARARWQSGEAWGGEVLLPSNFDWKLADAKTRKPVSTWLAMGVRPAMDVALPLNAEASILLPAGSGGPAFITLNNFRSILRYNNSSSYALAISLLAERITGAEKHQFNWPEQARPLSLAQRKELQELLTAKGYDTLGADGIIGPNSRRALRAWQSANGHQPDGYPSLEQLEQLRQQ